jgi:hypothetical protein
VVQGTAGPIYVSAAPPAPETFVRCNTTAETIDATRLIPQTKLNQELSQPVGPEFWSTRVFGRFQNVTVESHGTRRHPSGIQVQEAVVSYDENVGGEVKRGRTQSTIFVTPGSTFGISCNAEAPKYAKYKSAFAAIANSFRPSDANMVNAMPPVAPMATTVSFSDVLMPDRVSASVTFNGEGSR